MCNASSPRPVKGSSPKLLFLFAVFCGAMTVSSSAQTLTTLNSLAGPPSAGTRPYAAVIQATDGNFYGTTAYGGAHDVPACDFGTLTGCGTVFKITPDGTLTTLYSFCAQTNCTDGATPYGGLVQGTDGNFYGTTYSGGANGPMGTIFKITPQGALTTLYSFCAQGCTDGQSPHAGLAQASDGNFYGTTAGGGSPSTFCPVGCGTLFKITPTGAFTSLYSFQSTDGYGPNAALVQGTDGNLYGTTKTGGLNTAGTVFSMTLTGTLSSIYSFCAQTNCADGSTPYAGLVQGTDGNFYGTTWAGGSSGVGTAFKITPAGALTTLHSFNGSGSTNPYAGLVQASDGNFYGTTFGSGAFGTIYRMTPAGSLATLHSFTGGDGSNPYSELIQAADGNFYGTTGSGGASNDGTVFKFSGPTPAATQFVPVTPCRLVDTRQTQTPITGGTWQTFIVSQLGGCNIPAGATAYSLNVSVVPHGQLGYLTVWPAGRPKPYVSTLNSLDGRIKGNAAIVPAGASGAVSVYATNTTDVILDINGYFAPPAQNTLQFYPLPPCRVVDTRDNVNPPPPPGLGAPYLQNMEVRDLPFLTSPCLSGINNPQAYSINVAVVPHPSGTRLNYLTVWPSDQPQPFVATLNNPTATVVANAAIVPAAANGNIKVFAYNSTDVIMDINGYFAAPGQNGLSFYSVPPCRAYDSRANNGQPFRGTRAIPVAGSQCAPPANAGAYVFSAAVVPSGVMPYLTLWPDGEQQPFVATLNAYDGYITSNMAIVPNENGVTDAYADALTQLILDISGYFAP